MVEDLLNKLNTLKTNFTVVDETVPLISLTTRVREAYKAKLRIIMYIHTYICTCLHVIDRR